MKTCIKCGSHAFNLYAEGIDQGGFCDVHYWQGRAHRAEAQPPLPVQPEQEPWCMKMNGCKTKCEDCPDEAAQPAQEPCGGCGGSGWISRDPDIGTDQECFVCNGSGTQPNEPEQEPVAYFDWLPEEATHIAQIKVKTRSGGRLEMGAYVFKYDNEVLMVYTTDNDNEYPGWREAKQCFYHLNFPVFPIPTTPPEGGHQ